MTRLSFDYETFSSVDLKTQGLDRYSASPDARVLMCAYSFNGDAPRLWEPHRGQMPAELKDALLDPRVIKWAFNAQFERVITRRVLKLATPYEGWRCTMALAYLQGFKGTLGEVGDQMGLSDDVAKDKDGQRLIRMFSMPQKVSKNQPHAIRNWRTDPEDWKKFGRYCVQDVVAEQAIWQRLIKYPIPEIEWEIYEFDQRVNDRGKPVDVVFAQHAKAMAARRKVELIAIMREITGLSNPNSGQQILPWLRERGYPFADLEAESVQKALKENNDAETGGYLSADCVQVLQMRKHSTRLSVSKYDTLLNAYGRGDRMRFLFQFAGASRTRRWAGRRVQTQNLPRTPKAIDAEDDDGDKLGVVTNLIRAGDYEGLSFVMGEPMDALVGCLRSAFGTQDGKHMIAADLASIEACVVAWLFDVLKMLSVIRAGRDIYKDFGTYMFRKPYEEITKFERTLAKPPTLGAPYRLGGGELHDGRRTGLWGYAENMGVDMTREQSHEAVRVFREVYAPEVVEAWKALERAVQRAMNNGNKPVTCGRLTFQRMPPYMTLILPSGGRLFYYSPRMETRVIKTKRMIRRPSRGFFEDGAPKGEMIEEPETYTRQVFTYMGQNQDTQKWERLENHGGRFVEQSVQAMARDVLATQMLRADRAGYRIVAHIHDEAVAEHDIGDNEHTLAGLIEIMRQPIPWADGLPLGAAGWVGRFYRK